MRNHVHEQMEEYLAGQMELKALRNFRQHLASCRSCANALEDMRVAGEYLQQLRQTEAPPEPGPQFFYKVQSSIEKKLDSGWLANLAAAMRGPRLAFPILFLFLGLLLSAWTITAATDWDAEGIMGIPPRQFSNALASQQDRDLVMVSLIDGVDSR